MYHPYRHCSGNGDGRQEGGRDKSEIDNDIKLLFVTPSRGSCRENWGLWCLLRICP